MPVCTESDAPTYVGRIDLDVGAFDHRLVARIFRKTGNCDNVAKPPVRQCS